MSTPLFPLQVGNVIQGFYAQDPPPTSNDGTLGKLELLVTNSTREVRRDWTRRSAIKESDAGEKKREGSDRLYDWLREKKLKPVVIVPSTLLDPPIQSMATLEAFLCNRVLPDSAEWPKNKVAGVTAVPQRRQFEVNLPLGPDGKLISVRFVEHSHVAEWDYRQWHSVVGVFVGSKNWQLKSYPFESWADLSFTCRIVYPTMGIEGGSGPGPFLQGINYTTLGFKSSGRFNDRMLWENLIASLKNKLLGRPEFSRFKKPS